MNRHEKQLLTNPVEFFYSFSGARGGRAEVIDIDYQRVPKGSFIAHG